LAWWRAEHAYTCDGACVKGCDPSRPVWAQTVHLGGCPVAGGTVAYCNLGQWGLGDGSIAPQLVDQSDEGTQWPGAH